MTISSKIETYHQSKGLKRLWIGLGISTLIILIVVAAYFKIRSIQKQLSKTRSETELLRVKSNETLYKLEKETEHKQMKVLLDEYHQTQHDIDLLDRQAKTQQAEIAAQLSEIEKLSSWADLNEYNKRGRS